MAPPFSFGVILCKMPKERTVVNIFSEGWNAARESRDEERRLHGRSGLCRILVRL
jgi:hypothetical protein